MPPLSTKGGTSRLSPQLLPYPQAADHPAHRQQTHQAISVHDEESRSPGLGHPGDRHRERGVRLGDDGVRQRSHGALHGRRLPLLRREPQHVLQAEKADHGVAPCHGIAAVAGAHELLPGRFGYRTRAKLAVELVPGSAAAHRVLGQILLSKARDKEGIEAALPELKRANDLQPAEPSGALALGQAYLRLDRPEEAATVLSRVQDRVRGPMLPLLYGEALEKAGKPDEAEEVYLGILRQDAENPAASLGLLRVYQTTRKFDKALPILADLVKRQPGNLGLRAQYGFALLRARRLDEAEKTFKEVLAADPDNRDALRHYSSLLSERLETDRADELLKKLQGLEPDDADVAFRRALNFLEARRLEDAETVLNDLRSTLVAQKAPSGGIASVDGQLGYVALLRKDWAAARAAVKPHLLDEDGTVNLQALNLLVQVAREAEEPAEGLRICREAFAKQPKELGIRSLLAEFLLRSEKEKDRAEGEELVAAIAKEGRPGALAAADVWQRLERYDRASQAATAALVQFPDDPDLLKALLDDLRPLVDKAPRELLAALPELEAIRQGEVAGLIRAVTPDLLAHLARSH